MVQIRPMVDGAGVQLGLASELYQSIQGMFLFSDLVGLLVSSG
jgi:hypothetical protein